jgi:hypothetical protein
MPERARDIALSTTLVTSPGWALYIGHINVLLTTATLLVGLVIGVLRIRQMLNQKESPDE